MVSLLWDRSEVWMEVVGGSEEVGLLGRGGWLIV